MSFHIVTIDSPDCFLGCKNGQITCKSGSTTRTLPIEDVASIIITGFTATIHSQLLLEAARHGVSLVFCEAYKPLSVLLPANRCTDTLLTRAQVELSNKKRSNLWSVTIDAKCTNQLTAAILMEAKAEELESLKREAAISSSHKEASCAKMYWKAFSQACGSSSFTRDKNQTGLNSHLNYGYAVLLSSVLQKLFAVGIDPTFGISHAIRERSTPLAYDLMEPFRPLVDLRVFQWVQKNKLPPTEQGIDKEFKKWMTGFLLEKTEHLQSEILVQSCIEAVVRSFRHAILSPSSSLYKPWILKNSKWGG
jgi:CRISPR-associated protein Cas1